MSKMSNDKSDNDYQPAFEQKLRIISYRISSRSCMKITELWLSGIQTSKNTLQLCYRTYIIPCRVCRRTTWLPTE